MIAPSGSPDASSTHTDAPADSVRKAAIGFYVRLCSGEATPADQEACTRWIAQHPSHQAAWQRLQDINATVRRVPGRIGASTLRAARSDRRKVLRAIVGLGATAWVGWQATSSEPAWRGWMADLRTATGEQRTVALADGSTLILNTRSAANVRIDATRRVVRLLRGEIYIETAHRAGTAAFEASHDARPFIVETPYGTVQALGTRFIVRLDDREVRVSVLEDAVAITPDSATQGAIRLEAGRQMRFDSQHASTQTGIDAGLDDWTRGSLIVDDWRLQDVIAELSRYRHGRLACDPAVANLRVSGSFPLKDTDKALAALTRSFALRIRTMTPYWVTVGPT